MGESSIGVKRMKSIVATLESHIGGALQVLAAPVPIQPPANAPGKATDDGPGTSIPDTHLGTQTQFLAPGFTDAQTWLLHSFGE